MSKGRKLKRPSKRIALNKKYKIQKKVRDHHKKQRKEMKRHPEKFRKPKDPGVPNSLPFKAQIIEETRENREREVEHNKIVQKELKMRSKNEKGVGINVGQKISELVGNAQKRNFEFEQKKAFMGEMEKNVLHDKSAKAYYREFRKVVDTADVVLEVLDSRDPQGTRCIPMEELIVAQAGKKLVFVLNKADLVPKDNLEAWIKHLRRERPAVAFKASTQNQSSNLSHSKVSIAKGDLSSSKCIGADVLMQLLKNYCRNDGIKTAISVGVVGLPNVGKSSIINSLKRSKACNVGSTPGVTKSLQEIQLDSKIRLLDCPGVILPGANVDDASSVLRNAIKVENIEDYYGPVDAIVNKAGMQQMMLHYALPAFKDTSEFLALMSQKTGKLKKGGMTHVEAAGRKVLKDWNSGRIKYYTRPPEVKDGEMKSALVAEFSKEFDLEGLELQENKFMESLPSVRESDTVCVNSLGPLMDIEDGEKKDGEVEMSDEENETEIMELDDDEKENGGGMLPEGIEIEAPALVKVVPVPAEKKKRWETKRVEVDMSTINFKKLQRKMSKKNRKERGRNERRTDDLVDAMNVL